MTSPCPQTRVTSSVVIVLLFILSSCNIVLIGL
nr:MAG TPA: hypothetical protein [Caudoviricetes sp.]